MLSEKKIEDFEFQHSKNGLDCKNKTVQAVPVVENFHSSWC